MEDSFAKELYSESLQLSNAELGSRPIADGQQALVLDCNKGELPDDVGSLWDGSDEEFNGESDLDREWQRRHDQFHTIGYRDGLIAGKEASAQEGFNVGFKQSVLPGYNWGVVRDLTSALACLPDALKEKLVETEEKRNKLLGFNESVHSISTSEALQFFHDDILRKKAAEQSEPAVASSHVARMNKKDSSGCSHLENYVGELQTLLESTSIRSNLSVE